MSLSQYKTTDINILADGQFMSTSTDPQILLELDEACFNIRFLCELETQEDSTECALYYSADGSFSEELKISLDTSKKSLNVIHSLPIEARYFRFDPQNVEGEFTISKLELLPLKGSKLLKVLSGRAFKQHSPGTLTRKFFRHFSPLKPRESIKLMMNSFLKQQQIELSVVDRNIQYAEWRELNMPTEAELQAKASKVKDFTYQPKISLVMPVYNPPIKYFRACLDSIRNQIYENWEICIGEDKSSNPAVVKTLKEYEKLDPRFKVVYRQENGHISKASNSALEVASGEFIGLVDHDDLLTKDALYEVITVLNENKSWDMIYTDEDKITDGKFINPSFKPDWNSDSFLSRMYTCHFGVYRKALIDKIGGFRAGYEGSQDYDLVLRFTELTDRVYHIPKILYHWRIHEESTAGGGDAKPYCFIAAEKALADALERRGEPGKVFDVPGLIGNYSIRYDLRKSAKVSIIIPTRDGLDYLQPCIESIFDISTYENFEIIVIDNGSEKKETLDFFKDWEKREPKRFKVLPADMPFNFSKLNNLAVEQASGEYLLFLNNDTKVITEDWIEAMLEQSQRPSIGAVGAKLLYPDNTVQHAGVLLGVGGIAVHSHRTFPDFDGGYLCNLATINNYSAVTGACLMCRKADFERVGGFDEELTVAYNDIDLCLKLRGEGLNNIYLPHAKLYHFESKSRGFDVSEEKVRRLERESAIMRERWSEYLEHDPCYNPNLTQKLEDYTLNV